ncbi:MAG: RNHCP domain-containing protein [bacterium]|nr:RNHCP domain-containing protein [bacterium]
MEKDFICINCNKKIIDSLEMGTRNRNHCPFCLYSLHADENAAGDRKSTCHGSMVPIGLTFKLEKPDKYKEDVGEIMLVHRCTKCGKISINRIAGDDDTEKIMQLVARTEHLIEKQELEKNGIQLLSSAQLGLVKRQLLGDPQD